MDKYWQSDIQSAAHNVLNEGHELRMLCTYPRIYWIVDN